MRRVALHNDRTRYAARLCDFDADVAWKTMPERGKEEPRLRNAPCAAGRCMLVNGKVRHVCR
jgi:hypothetical protein